METRKYEAMPGDHIKTASQQAIAIANEHNCKVEFSFNEIPLTATPGADADAIIKVYDAECDRRHQEYIASPEYKARQEEQARKEREREQQLAHWLADAPAQMTVKDADGWQKCRDVNGGNPYGAAILSYAERWARIMEGRMAKGERIADIAKSSSHIADSEGITGSMYGCAVGVLSQVWIHGEALRLWHNLDTQIGNEGVRANETGGVLNPAVLTIG